jgi:hypothetical protein
VGAHPRVGRDGAPLAGHHAGVVFGEVGSWKIRNMIADILEKSATMLQK